VFLAVGLEGAGWHPAAWREPDARPAELFSAAYWRDLIGEADRGGLDLVTIEDSLGPGDERVDRVTGRLDAVLIAARVAPLTRRVGLVPAGVVTHTEPFHLSKAIATLDYVSAGRAGWQVLVTGRQSDADHFGRRVMSGPAEELFEEAADYVEVVRRLWDSWEDDAEIRDAGTGRFVDRDKLHYIDFAGQWFSVKGPSITPRPPQGQPLVVVPARGSDGYRLAGRAADVVLVTAQDVEAVRNAEQRVRAEQANAGRAGETIHVFGDLVVFLDETSRQAAARRARLDDWAGKAWQPDAPVFTGTPAELADELTALADAGLSGFRLRPGALPHDLTAITNGLVPKLAAGAADAPTLRGRLGLGRPANRYATASTLSTGDDR
jgi:alkanesulfonate monooxygenase SsuD/methylene tetrahydromethanopterin reductase-like flavin-dependent oxidoreductase (luciferase family)